MTPAPLTDRAEVRTRVGTAPRSRRFWRIAAVVLLALGMMCLPLAVLTWFLSSSPLLAALVVGAAAVWWLLAGAGLVMSRSQALEGGGEARPLLGVGPERVVVAGGLHIPYGDLGGLRLEWTSAAPRSRSPVLSGRVVDGMMEDALERGGGTEILTVTLDVPSHRVDSAPLAVFSLVEVAPSGPGRVRVEIRCHPLLVTGDLASVHRILQAQARRAGVPPLPR